MRKGKIVVVAAILLTLSLVISLMILASCSKKREPQSSAKETTIDAPKVEMQKAEVAIATTAVSQPNTSGKAAKPKVEQPTVKAAVKEPNKMAAAKAKDVNSAAKKAAPAVEKPSIQKLLAENWFWKQVGKEWYGTRIRDANLTDIDGKHYKISDCKGKNVIVVSFTTWCPGSEAQIKHFMVDLRKEISENELVILGIAAKTTHANDTLEKLREYIKKFKVNFPVCYIEPEATPAPFNSNMNVPCSYFINRNGNLVVAIQDIITTKYLKKLLEAMQ